MKGIKYGGISPKNYNGLQLWNRATDGVTVSSGGYVYGWKDISGIVSDGSRDWKPYERTSASYITGYGGIIGNSINGLWVAGTTSPVFALPDSSFKKILYDGSPVTLFIVFRINSVQTNSGFPFFNTGASGTTGGSFSLSSPVNGQQGCNTRNQSTALESTILPGVYPSGLKTYVLAMKDYGYNAASPDLHRKYYVNNELKAEKKFLSAPNQTNDNLPMILGCGATANGIHEIFIYDNTGKDATQIDFEFEKLYNDYILKRYPNLNS